MPHLPTGTTMAQSPRSSVILKLMLRFGNPLNWSTVDKCLLILAIGLMFQAGMLAAWRLFLGLGSPSGGLAGSPPSWLNVGFLNAGLRWYCANWAFQCLQLACGTAIRRRSPDSPWFAHLVVQSHTVAVLLFCYTCGLLSHPSILFPLAAGTVFLLLFPAAVSIASIVTFTLGFIALSVATGIGWFPYAPGFLSPPTFEGRSDWIYTGSTFIGVLAFYWLTLALVGYVVWRWRQHENSLAAMTELLRKMFGRYLSPEVMDALTQDPAALELGGQRRRVTIMMADLRGFTAISERLQPERVVEMLNTCFAVIVDVVHGHQGTIIEISGDALLVVFGAPQQIPDRSRRAIACAIDMQNAMAEVNRRNRAKGLPDLEMGIGLNAAEVIVGNIGSHERSKYAVIGSGVNTASRIESYTVGGQVLISESVYREAADDLRIDGRKEVLFKGAPAPQIVYAVGGIAGHYNRSLEKGQTATIDLVHPIRFRYVVLEGKNVGRQGAEGTVSRLSKSGAEITFAQPVLPLTNLKLNIAEVDGLLAVTDFYGKVTAITGGNGLHGWVDFTALPPEIDAYFQALLNVEFSFH